MQLVNGIQFMHLLEVDEIKEKSAASLKYSFFLILLN